MWAGAALNPAQPSRDSVYTQNCLFRPAPSRGWGDTDNLSWGTGFQEAPEVEEEALQFSDPCLLLPQVFGFFFKRLHLLLQLGEPVPE